MDERVTVTNATCHTGSHYTQRGRPHPKRDAAADDHAWDADDARSDWPGFLALAGFDESIQIIFRGSAPLQTDCGRLDAPPGHAGTLGAQSMC